MKKLVSVKILWLVVGCCLLYGCGRFGKTASADERFPDSIGGLRRDIIYNEKEGDYQNEKNKNQKYKSRGAKYSQGDDEFLYDIGLHQNETDAVNELATIAVSDNNSVWKTFDLKDKSGKNVGKMTVCRVRDSSPDSPHAASGGFNYSLAFNLNNQSYRVASPTYTHSWTPQATDKFVAFVKALPTTQQLDLSMLDVITTSMAGKVVTAEKLSAIAPPVKTAAAPYLKGKIAVMVTGEHSSGVRTEEFIEDSAQQAILMDEVGSIIRLDCAKGALIGQYTVADKGTKIPAYSLVCQTSIIDKTVPAVIAKKTFTNSSLVEKYSVETERDGKLKNYEKEYVAPLPRKEVAEFLSKLPKK